MICSYLAEMLMTWTWASKHNRFKDATSSKTSTVIKSKLIQTCLYYFSILGLWWLETWLSGDTGRHMSYVSRMLHVSSGSNVTGCPPYQYQSNTRTMEYIHPTTTKTPSKGFEVKVLSWKSLVDNSVYWNIKSFQTSFPLHLWFFTSCSHTIFLHFEHL